MHSFFFCFCPEEIVDFHVNIHIFWHFFPFFLIKRNLFCGLKKERKKTMSAKNIEVVLTFFEHFCRSVHLYSLRRILVPTFIRCSYFLSHLFSLKLCFALFNTSANSHTSRKAELHITCPVYYPTFPPKFSLLF